MLGVSNKKCGTSLVKFLYGGTTTNDVVAPVAVVSFEFGVLKTVRNEGVRFSLGCLGRGQPLYRKANQKVWREVTSISIVQVWFMRWEDIPLGRCRKD